MCASIYGSNEHLTAKDLKSHESILLMRVLKPERRRDRKPFTLFFQFVFPSSFPTLLPPFSLLLSSVSISARKFLCSRSTYNLRFGPFCRFHVSLLSFFPFFRPASRHQVAVNCTIISSSQMHFASLLHSDKLNILSKHFFQERRHLMFCFHGFTNLTSDCTNSRLSR